LVTGGSGFLGSQVVKTFLDKGYKVRATVRDPTQSSHLSQLPGASERLELFKADLLVDGAFDEAVVDCVGVIHTASPFFFKNVTDPEAQLLQPALKGTLNVLESTKKKGNSVRRVVLTSSMAAIGYNFGALPDSHVYTDADWSNDTLLREKQVWYPLSKTIAERAAWKFMEDNEGNLKFDLVVVNPTLILGPLLQPTLNTSTDFLADYLTGRKTEIANASMSMVDVRDTADAHLLCFEKPEAKGRYPCVEGHHRWAEWCKIMKDAHPGGKVTDKVADEPEKAPMLVDNSKLKSLGWKPRSITETLTDTVKSVISSGLIDKM
jgi:nucleoside-diphosphate-sugar epimerase